MEKIEMREWVAQLEEIIDNKLKLWRKGARIENGEVLQIQWQFEMTHIIMDIFWHDGKETVNLQYLAPRAKHNFTWHELKDDTFNKIMDRVGNLAQMTMYPRLEE